MFQIFGNLDISSCLLVWIAWLMVLLLFCSSAASVDKLNYLFRWTPPPFWLICEGKGWRRPRRKVRRRNSSIWWLSSTSRWYHVLSFVLVPNLIVCKKSCPLINQILFKLIYIFFLLPLSKFQYLSTRILYESYSLTILLLRSNTVSFAEENYEHEMTIWDKEVMIKVLQRLSI